MQACSRTRMHPPPLHSPTHPHRNRYWYIPCSQAPRRSHPARTCLAVLQAPALPLSPQAVLSCRPTSADDGVARRCRIYTLRTGLLHTVPPSCVQSRARRLRLRVDEPNCSALHPARLQRRHRSTRLLRLRPLLPAPVQRTCSSTAGARPQIHLRRPSAATRLTIAAHGLRLRATPVADSVPQPTSVEAPLVLDRTSVVIASCTMYYYQKSDCGTALSASPASFLHL